MILQRGGGVGEFRILADLLEQISENVEEQRINVLLVEKEVMQKVQQQMYVLRLQQ